MHIYFFARGKFEQVELWKSHVQSAYWKLRRINNTTGKEEVILCQGALRPSVFGAYEYIFPKEALAEVCSFLGIDGGVWGGFSAKFDHFLMRQVFNCRKIPKKILERAKEIPSTFSTNEFERGCADCKIPGVILHTIGIKDDRIGEMGGYTYELL